MLERIGEPIELLCRHAKAAPDLAPLRNCLFHFAKYLPGTRRCNPKIRQHRHQRLNRCLRTGIFRHPRPQFSNTIWKRIDIECRRQPPLAAIDMQEAVIAQMIVDVGDEDGEGDSPPEFLGIRLRRAMNRAGFAGGSNS